MSAAGQIAELIDALANHKKALIEQARGCEQSGDAQGAAAYYSAAESLVEVAGPWGLSGNSKEAGKQETGDAGRGMPDAGYFIIFTPPGEIPQAKAFFDDIDKVETMLNEMRPHYPAETIYIVVSIRWGQWPDIHPSDAAEWMDMNKVGRECASEEAAYIEAGVCSDCGACSLAEARGKCRTHPLGDTGDHTCAGERLWEDERENEEEGGQES